MEGFSSNLNDTFTSTSSSSHEKIHFCKNYEKDNGYKHVKLYSYALLLNEMYGNLVSCYL